MINQMSILARSFNVDGILATEGGMALEDIAFDNTIRVREMSPNNPINLDVVGTIQAIQRDFKEVPNLVRLIRQDVGGKANIPEELLWSSERGAFASGDPTEGAQEKQWESIKYIHRDVAYQLRRIAMLLVIDALGLDRQVMRALPYTSIWFDNPVVANAEIRAKIAESLGKAAFDMRSAGFPADAVAQIMSSYGDDEFSVRSDLLDDLKKRQAEVDAQEREKHEKDMELMDAQIWLTEEQAKTAGVIPAGGMGGKAPVPGKKGEGYTRLQQHSKEKTRGTAARMEGMQRAQGKMRETQSAR
jgi:NACalpha-BTF3-like transcription factor